MRVGATGRGLAWPTRGALRAYLAWGITWEIVFFSVYLGTNGVTEQRAVRHHLYVQWELGIPLVPSMIWVYLSILVLYIVPLFQMDERAMPRLAKQMLLATVVGGGIFLLLPAELGFPRDGQFGNFASVFSGLHAFDRPYNLVPSLHIALTTLVVLALVEPAALVLKIVYAAWLGLITLSVLLVHQHHLVDIVTGFALAALCRRIVTGATQVTPMPGVADLP